MKKYLALLALILYPALVSAQCTGAGAVWACLSGTTPAQLNTAIGLATTNPVLTFANGSYSWGGTVINLPPTKGVTLICATVGGCTVTASSQAFSLQGISGTLSNLFRISGFTFNLSGTPQGLLWIEAGSRAIVNQFRWDHCTFNINSSGNYTVLFVGDTTSNTYVYGVMDHNTGVTVGPHPSAIWFGIGQYDPSPPIANTLGTGNNIFLEDNTWSVTTNTDVSSPCFTDAWGFQSVVVRHNTITNCLEVLHDLTHGGPPGPQAGGGPQNAEFYNNRNIQTSGIAGQGADDGYRMTHHQGAQTEIFFFNTYAPLTEPHSGDTISALANYVDGACSVYPCGGVAGAHGPQPGRDTAVVLRPIYGWGNSDANNGTLVDIGNESAEIFVKSNRDIYTGVSVNPNSTPTSPFNGTVGTGYGTLANRPTTCTHSNPTNPTLSPADNGHGGVGYAYGTTIGTIGASVGAGIAGDYVLSACTALNTWTDAYTPFTYPHPLVGGGGGIPGVSLSGNLTFGNQAQNTPSSTKIITLTNSGTATLNISSIAFLTGTNYAIVNRTCGTTLGAGLNCQVSVVFTPNALILFTDTLRFVTDASTSPDDIPATGTGVIPTVPATQFASIEVDILPLPLQPIIPSLTKVLPSQSYLSSKGLSQDGITFNSKVVYTVLGANITTSSICQFDGGAIACTCVSGSCVLTVPATTFTVPVALQKHFIGIGNPGPSIPILN